MGPKVLLTNPLENKYRTLKMEVWKMMLLHFGVIFRFQAFGWKGCFSQNLFFGYETTNHCITKSSTLSISVLSWCCRNLMLTVITKLQISCKSWKFPPNLAFFCQSPSPQLFFIVTGISEDIQGRHVSPCRKRLRNVECHRRKAICLAKSIGTS